jgi:hypothetical protein
MVQQPITKAIRLQDVFIDERTQLRVDGLQEPVVVEYVEAMENGAIFPAIVVYFDGSQHVLADGFHRVEAYRRRGLETVDAIVYTGTVRDAIEYAIGANLRHGLRATRADKQHAVETMLLDEVWTGWSDREIGKKCGVDGKTVASMRIKLGLERSTTRTTMRAGRLITIETGNIGAKRSNTSAEATAESSQSAAVELSDKDKAKVDAIAQLYGWSVEAAHTYISCTVSKREQDKQRRLERKAEQDKQRQKVLRKMQRNLSDQTRKRIQSGLSEATELAKQYGVSTAVVLEVVQRVADKKR